MATPYRVALCALCALATRHVDLALPFPEPRDWRLRVLIFLLGRTQQVDTVYEPSFLELANSLLLALGPSLGNWIAQARHVHTAGDRAVCVCVGGGWPPAAFLAE